MTESFNPITLEGLNSSSEVHYFNNNVSFFEPVDVFGGLELQSAANVEKIFEKVCVYEEAGYDEIKIPSNIIDPAPTGSTLNVISSGGAGTPKFILIIGVSLIQYQYPKV